MTSTSGCVYSL